jgi:hypothetical protein
MSEGLCLLASPTGWLVSGYNSRLVGALDKDQGEPACAAKRMASKERPSYEALSCRSNLHAAINLIEQDHRGVKLRIGPMLGFRLVSSRPIRIARLIVPSRTITRTLGVDLKTPTGRLVLSDSAAWT